MQSTVPAATVADRPLYDLTPLLPWIDAGAVLLTPNLRLSRYMRQAWDARQLAEGRLAWPTLETNAVEQWLQSRWHEHVMSSALAPRRCLDKAEELILWERVIAECASPDTPFSLLQPRVAARSAQQARDYLLRWRIDLGSPATRQQFELDADADTFLLWLERFELQLEGAGLATPADCLMALASLDKIDAGRAVLLVECEGLSPLVELALSRHCAPLERYRRPGRNTPVTSRGYTDERAESRAIASWCVDRLRQAPGSRVGVVLADSGNQRLSLDYFLRREFDCLDAPFGRLPVNYTAGITLDRAPLVRDALAVLSLLKDSVELRTLEQVVDSRFMPLADRHTPPMNRLMHRIRQLGAVRVDSGLLRELANSEPGEGAATPAGSVLGRQLLRSWQRLARLERQLPSAWVALFNAVLADWQWLVGAKLDSLEYQQWSLWQETLDRLAGLDALTLNVDLDTAQGLLAQLCAARIFQPKTEDRDIQILGPLEAAGLAFDYLWVSGMQEGQWPSPARPNPFIPIALQRQSNLPGSSAGLEWAFADNLMARYRSAVGELHLSFTLERDGSPAMPSALLADCHAAVHDVAPESDWPALADEAAALETHADDCAPAVAEEEQARLRGGSGLLGNQSACPFRAFARHRLRVESADAGDAALSARERGILLHAALRLLWDQLSDSHTLHRMSETERREHCRNAARIAVSGFDRWRRRIVGDAQLALEAQRLESLLQRWLEIEAARPVDFVVETREEQHSISLGSLKLDLQVDRIDRLADGGRLIIDYKSGGGSLADWLGERPAAPQLPLYALASGSDTAGITFAAVNRDKPGFTGLADARYAAGIRDDIEKAVGDRDTADSWDALRASWGERLASLAHAFLRGDAAVEPLSGHKTCRHCGLQALCRIGLAVDDDGLTDE